MTKTQGRTAIQADNIWKVARNFVLEYIQLFVSCFKEYPNNFGYWIVPVGLFGEANTKFEMLSVNRIRRS